MSGPQEEDQTDTKSKSQKHCLKHTNRDGHQNLKLLLIDPNQMHLIGFVERTILGFKSSKSDVSYVAKLWPLEYLDPFSNM